MSNLRHYVGLLVAAAVVLTAACGDDEGSPIGFEEPGQLTPAGKKSSDAEAAQAIAASLEEMNVALASSGADYRVAVAEYITPDGENMGQTIFARNVGNKQLGHDFVPGDARRGGFFDIAWLIDQEGATSSGLTAPETDAAIGRAMQTWQDVACADIPLTGLGSFPLDLGVVQNIFGFGGDPNLFTDVMHTGWLPGPFFDAIATGGSTFILGVTFSFLFCDPCAPTAVFTDIDGNGKLDTAFREIYYNDEFLWEIDMPNDPGVPDIDVETVALHEAGHGLSQAHFGKVFITNSNGMVHFAPRAVMNAVYGGPLTALQGTDNGGHCSNWSQWPNN